ncbi:MAG: 50S ribosomal protein L25 [Candidatus Magasanikbacteria bacterium]|nr:50S ribosomal protein L25 [Candidatus Magasanikbacteria bacterium]
MTFQFTAQKREGKNADDLRAAGRLPGVLYGQGVDSVSIAVERALFEKLYNEAGEASLIDFTLEGEKEPVKVLIQDVQYDPIKQKPIHFDLRQIRMDKEMEVAIELRFVGEAPAVKAEGGTLVKSMEELNIRCLPKDLVSSVEVDLTVLKTFNDAICVKDIKLPAGIKIVDDLNGTIATVARPLTEDQLKAMEETGPKSVEEVEVEKKGKIEEGVEGEAVPQDGAAPDKGPDKGEKKEEKKKE